MALTFPVSEEKNRLLRQRMEALGVREEDIEETFIRSSGHGGQHVNKTSTCVRLLHRPSGIEVKCMRERSQAMNRYLARRELLARLEGTSGPSARDAAIEKERKRKAKRRSRSSKKYSSEGESQ